MHAYTQHMYIQIQHTYNTNRQDIYTTHTCAHTTHTHTHTNTHTHIHTWFNTPPSPPPLPIKRKRDYDLKDSMGRRECQMGTFGGRKEMGTMM